MSNRPVLLLGLDGLGQQFLDSPLVAEAAPNLVALLRAGGVAPLRSTFPPYTAPAWTSITTGVGPGRHGVFGFTDADGHPVGDTSVGAPRLWDYVGEAGGRSVVLNMPITHPPRPISGVLVSGMPVPPGSTYAAPADVVPDDYIVDVAVREEHDESIDTIARLTEMTRGRGRLASRLARDETWDLFVVVFVLPDRLGHPWWKYLVSGDVMFDSREGHAVRAAAAESLRALDAAITDILDAVPAGTAVVACSDHGFGALRADVFVDVALADAGVVTKPAGAGAVARIGRSTIGRKLPGALRRLGRSAVQSQGRGPAWAAPPYECGVRLADPSRADDVANVLRGLRDPQGTPIVAAVLRREDLYSGPYADRAPDLLVEVADESVDLHDGFHAPSHWLPRDTVAWGTHRADGIVAVHGAPMTAKGDAPDVAATVLDLLGLSVEGLDGRSLVDSIGEHRPVDAGVATPAAPVYSEEEEEAVLEHLRGLGYVD